MLLCASSIVSSGAAYAQAVSDVLTKDVLGISDYVYGDFEGRTANSGAVYAGNASLTKSGTSFFTLSNSVQNSGIVTTSSVGSVVSVSSTWSSYDFDNIDKSLLVYGRNTAYESSADLYSSNPGELLGTLSSSNTTLEFEGKYAYIGLKAGKGGTAYLKDVTVEWELNSTLSDPELSFEASSYETLLSNGTFQAPLTKAEGVNAEDISYTSSNTTVATVNGNGLVTLLSEGETTITASFNGNEKFSSGTASYILTVSAPIKKTFGFDAKSATVQIGAKNTFPTFTNDYDESPVWSSSDESVATVDNNGTITLHGAGTATITAKLAEANVIASYSLIVNAQEEVTYSYIYEKVNSVADLVNNGYYLFADTTTIKGERIVLGAYCFLNSSNIKRYAVKVKEENNYLLCESVNKTGAAYEVILEKRTSGTDTYYFRMTNGKYLRYANSTNLTESAYLSSDNNLKWKLTSEKDVFCFKSVIANDRTLGYYKSRDVFGAYSSGNNSLYLYRRIGTVEIKAKEGYATFYTDSAFVMPSGLEGSTITEVDTSIGELTMPWNYKAGITVPAGTPLLLKGEVGEYSYVILRDDTDAPSDNLLRGTEQETAIENDADTYFYKLAYLNGNLGFYWGAENGAAFTNGANKAYLALPISQSSNVNGFSFNSGSSTGISNVESKQIEDGQIYSLTGVRMNGNLKTLPSGLYLMNGKKVIVK